MACTTTDFARGRKLPVVRWLQAGAVAAGMSVTLFVAPGVASADAGAGGSSSGGSVADTAQPSGRQAVTREVSGVRARRSTTNAPAAAAPVVAVRGSQVSRPVASARARVKSGAAVGAAPVDRPVAGLAVAEAASPSVPAANTTVAAAVPVAGAAVNSPAVRASAVTSPVDATADEPLFGFRPVVLVNSVFDDVSKLIGLLPGGPISNLLEGGLLLVRRLLVLPFSGWNTAPACVGTGDCSGQDLSGQNLSGLNLVNVNFTAAKLDGANLKYTLLHNSDLTHASFIGANLVEADINGEKLYNADFSNADCSYADLQEIADVAVAVTAAAKMANAEPPTPAGPGVNWEGANLRGANLSNAILTDAILRNADLRKANFSGAILNGADMSRVVARGVDLTGAKLIGAILTGGADLSAYINSVFAEETMLSSADFTDADLTGANFSGAIMASTDFTGAKLGGANLGVKPFDADGGYKEALSNLSSAIFSNADLTGATLTQANLKGAYFNDATMTGVVGLPSATNLQGTNFSGATLGDALKGADLSGRDLRGTIFPDGAQLESTNFSDADLTFAKLPTARLANADFSNANLTGATLTNTNMTYDKLIGANLSNAKLNNATVQAADLTNANLFKADITGASFALSTWSNTTCPNGTKTNTGCGTSSAAAQSTAIRSFTAAATAAVAGIATPVPNAATIAVTNWFSDTWNWLEGANNPVATALQNLLVGVQSTLFSPAPTVKPVQYTAWTAGDPILGALRYSQPGGAAVSFQLTTAPTSGTVQLLSDGTYTYTPGANFAGTDTFTAAVTSGGINLLDPLTPRTANVTVTINPQLPVMLTDGIDINNRTSQPVVLSAIKTTPGFEDSVGSKPVWSYWQPGDYMHVEVTKYLFTSYVAYFTFLACGDANCHTQYADKWIVKISPDISGDTYVSCTQGACTYVDDGPFSLRDSINLLDPGAGARGTPASVASAAPPAEAPAATTRCIKQVQLA